jgi:hypothetical protein
LGKKNNQYARLLSFIVCLLCSCVAIAQPTTLPQGQKRDTASDKTNTSTWKNEEADVYFETLQSAMQRKPDTSLHFFQRRPFVSTWARDMGNPGSPVYNLQFTPDNRVGPSLGYHIFDAYRFSLDSLPFYNTTRPYSVFSYTLGSRLEQVAGISHSQNIRPNWNFMVEYRKINMPGFYKIQRNNNDNARLTTSYKSLNKRYVMYAGLVYNKEQHDENGGIVNDSELSNDRYTDRKTLDVVYQNTAYSVTRSTISNMQRDLGVVLQHSYTWGPVDTVYNADSTQYTYTLKPRFSIMHKMQLSTEKHLYKDLAPDSVRYVPFFNTAFAHTGSAYYILNGDSVVTQQKWFWIDNKLLLNGFIGNPGSPLTFSAGVGNRYDEFVVTPAYNVNLDRSKIVSNYLAGEIKKEALKPGQWGYGAHLLFYLTGDYAGNFDLDASIGKDLNNNKGGFIAGFRQMLGSSPYSYTNYENRYAQLSWSFKNESITMAYASLDIRKINLQAGVRNYILDNYIYLNADRMPTQYGIAFNVGQAWLRKMFRLGNFYIDNELTYQQTTDNAPVNIPQLMGRHQFSYERAMFKQALKIATGVEVRYNTAYHPAGYDAQLNRFFYQDKVYVNNTPELSVFLNFRVKHFRAFIMADQLNQIFARNTLLYTGVPVYNFFGTGTTNTPMYAAQNFMLRFGFSWVLIN